MKNRTVKNISWEAPDNCGAFIKERGREGGRNHEGYIREMKITGKYGKFFRKNLTVSR